MPYVQGGQIQAADYNDFMGLSGTGAYPSNAAAANKAGAHYGVGFGSRGYGQTTLVGGNVVAGNVIQGSEWLNLRNILATCRLHQTGAVPGPVPPVGAFDPGDTIISHDGITNPDNIPGELANSDAQRFNVGGARTTVNPGWAAVTRGAAWSTTINASVRVNFADGDQIRHFFNGGGRIRFQLSHPGGTPQDNNWNNALANRLGFIYFGATNTTTSGSLGISSGVGLWDVGLGFTNVFGPTNIGTGAYSANDVQLETRWVAGAGALNGGLGSQVEFRITLRDEHTSVWFDTVSAGTALNTVYDRYAAVLTAPSYLPASFTVTNGF